MVWAWLATAKLVMQCGLIASWQGEYVCVSQLEATYTAGCASMRQMYMYGNPLRDHLLAVVVPRVGARPA